MTEAGWMACDDSDGMLRFLESHLPGDDEWGGDPFHIPEVRKVRLFAVACCRRVEHLLTDKRSRNALDVMERFLDRRATRRQYERATEAASDVTWDYEELADGRLQAARAVYSALDDIVDDFADAREAASEAVDAVTCAIPEESDDFEALYGQARRAERSYQAQLLRDIFGNPFRPVAFAPEWGTGTAVALARQMYDSRDFGAMPILADALQGAGCDSDNVLSHCRSDGPHVRGCWVVDLVLGKE